MRRACAAALVAWLAVSGMRAQHRWERVPQLTWGSITLANQPALDRVLLHRVPLLPNVGSPETWEWTRGAWVLRRQTSAPSIGNGRMVFDPRFGRLMLFGTLPLNRNYLRHFVWDGQSWLPAGAPGRADGLPMGAAYDAKRKELVLQLSTFTTTQRVDETWVHTTAWQRRWQSKPRTTYRQDPHFVAWSARLQQVVRVALDNGTATTLRWDGRTWTTFSGTTPLLLALAADPVSRNVLGVDRDPAGYARLHVFDGRTWRTQGSIAARLRPSSEVWLVPRGGRLLLLIDGPQTWEFDGTSWHDRTPPSAEGYCIAHDQLRDEDVIFDETTGNTWLYDVHGYRPVATRTRPGGAGCSLTWHPGLRGVVMLRGSPATLWRWSGTDWQRIPSSGGPQGPLRYPLTFDVARNVLVVMDSTTATWEWDARNRWRLAAPQNKIHPSLVAYDWRLRRVLLEDGMGLLYTWSGKAWTKLPNVKVPAGWGGGTVYSPLMGGQVSAGRARYRTMTGRTWLFDGAWRELKAGEYPGGLGRNVQIVFDAGRQCVRMYHGGIYELRDRTLQANRADPRPGDGFRADVAWPAFARRPFVLNLAFGTKPGIPVQPTPQGAVLLPLTNDALLAASFGLGLVTLLDGAGKGTIPLAIPSGRSLVGLRFYMAGWTFGALGIDGVTNAVRIEIVP